MKVQDSCYKKKKIKGGLHQICHMSRFLMDTDVYMYTLYYFQFIYLFFFLRHRYTHDFAFK